MRKLDRPPPRMRGGTYYWTDGAWVYRQRDGQTRCIGRSEVGSAGMNRGAIALHDGERWVSAASPNGSLRALDPEFVMDSPLVWSEDGQFLIGRDADGMEHYVELRRGRSRPLPGPTVPLPHLWATADWDTGEGYWFDPHTGERHGTFTVPVTEDDVVSNARAEDGEVVFVTAEGHEFRLPAGEVPPMSVSDL